MNQQQPMNYYNRLLTWVAGQAPIECGGFEHVYGRSSRPLTSDSGVTAQHLRIKIS